MEKEGKLPDVVMACVGGGSNAIGAFYEFIGDSSVRLIGCEAAERDWTLTSMRQQCQKVHWEFSTA